MIYRVQLLYYKGRKWRAGLISEQENFQAQVTHVEAETITLNVG